MLPLAFDGYSIKDVVPTEGPAEWISRKGRNYSASDLLDVLRRFYPTAVPASAFNSVSRSGEMSGDMKFIDRDR
jgi:hypothetical protein